MLQAQWVWKSWREKWFAHIGILLKKLVSVKLHLLLLWFVTIRNACGPFRHTTMSRVPSLIYTWTKAGPTYAALVDLQLLIPHPLICPTLQD